MPMVHVEIPDRNGALVVTEMLRCINHVLGSQEFIFSHEEAIRDDPVAHGSTMRSTQPWIGVPHVHSLTADPLLDHRLWTNNGVRMTGIVMPVRCFVCFVCGYVEMYSGEVTDPDIWEHIVNRQVK